MGTIKDSTDYIDALDKSCPITVKSDDVPDSDLIVHVQRWISDVDDKNEIIRILELSPFERKKAFRDKHVYANWFLEQLCEAVFQYNINEYVGWSPTELSPESFILKNKLRLKYAHRFKVVFNKNARESHFRVNIPYKLVQLYDLLRASIGAHNDTIEIIIAYGISHHNRLLSNYRYVGSLRHINETFVDECSTLMPCKFIEALTNSSWELYRQPLCSVSDVINSSEHDRVQSTKIDDNLYNKFTRKSAESTINLSELFSLYIMAFAANSDSGKVKSLLTDSSSEFFQSALMHHQNKLNDVAFELKNALKHLLAYSIPFELTFNNTINLLSRLTADDEYYRDFYNTVKSNTNSKIIITYDTKHELSEMQTTLNRSYDEACAYSDINKHMNVELKIARNELKISEHKSIELGAEIDKQSARINYTDTVLTRKNDTIRALNENSAAFDKLCTTLAADVNELNEALDKKSDELNEYKIKVTLLELRNSGLLTENQKVKDSFSRKIINGIKNLFRIT